MRLLQQSFKLFTNIPIIDEYNAYRTNERRIKSWRYIYGLIINTVLFINYLFSKNPEFILDIDDNSDGFLCVL